MSEEIEQKKGIMYCDGENQNYVEHPGIYINIKNQSVCPYCSKVLIKNK